MMDTFDYLMQPFAHGFMRQAFIIALVSLIPAALLSCFVVLRNWALMGDALSHAVLPGLIGAYILGIPMLLGAFVAALFTVFMNGFIKSRSRIKEDTVLGIVFSGMFGLGLMMYTSYGVQLHIERLLFGDLLGVTQGDVITSSLIGGFIILVIFIKWREFMLLIFDMAQFSTLGLSEPLYRYGFLSLLSLAVVGALKVVGLLLTVSMLVAPGVIALMITQRFSRMLMLSIIIAALSGFVGTYLSFFLDSSPAGTIVVLQALIFMILFCFKRICAVFYMNLLNFNHSISTK